MSETRPIYAAPCEKCGLRGLAYSVATSQALSGVTVSMKEALRILREVLREPPQ